MKCKCGCNQEFEPSRTTMFRLKRGDDVGYLPGHGARGKRNPRWKGGYFISSDGYVYILQPDHPNALKKGYVGYIAEHRLVMSNYLGRILETNELVHHVNGDKSDNRIENLVLITRQDHASIHHQGKNNANWNGGRKTITCKTCGKDFLPKDRRNDYGAKYCSKVCFYGRHK